MTQREWADKDFYAELGVAKTATADEIRKAYRKLARELHPDANPGNKGAEERFKRVNEANSVLSDSEKRKEYDELQAMLASGAFRNGSGGGFGSQQGGSMPFDLGDLFGEGQGAGDLGDILGGMFGRGGGRSRRKTSATPRGGSDVQAEITLDFRDAANGTTLPLNITTPSSCITCHGSGAKEGSTPHTCSKCGGSGYINTNRGAFGFSEPCPECNGTGVIIDDPCPTCHGTGITERTRKISIRIPAGIADGQRIRLAGQGEAGYRGAPSGDLFVTVHVKADKIFGRKGDNLTLDLPVSFAEAALGATVSVPTLGNRVGMKVPPGTSDGKVMRLRGKGIHKANGNVGDLLVTMRIQVPKKLDDEAQDALRDYAEAEKDFGFDPRKNWAGK